MSAPARAAPGSESPASLHSASPTTITKKNFYLSLYHEEYGTYILNFIYSIPVPG